MKSRSSSKISSCSSMQDKLKIIIRIRPILNQEDQTEFVKLKDENMLEIRRPGNHSYMKFSNILAPNSNQKDLFNLVKDSVKQFLQGVNTTIFAYGQTGAGKTYSMIGNFTPDDSQENLFNFLSSNQRGVLSRSLQMIMSTINDKNTTIDVSFFEIYNEKIYDLYNNTLIPLQIRQSKSGEISIPELINIKVHKMQQAIQYLIIGLKNRATGSTHANAKSSRSHSIFQINIRRQNFDGNLICSSLRIVDLAGSQKFKIPSDISPLEKQIRIQQLTSINGSLSCLGHCISALIEKSRTHIPFRNSKLTRILSDSLLGLGKMRFIICISPSNSASAQTFSTLQFASRAKRAIFERSDMRIPQLNKKKSQVDETIQFLKKQLQKYKQQKLILQHEILKTKKQNNNLKQENNQLNYQLKQKSIQKNNIYDNKKIITKNNNNHCISKITNLSIKQNNNNFKDQMLKLPIFQNYHQKDQLNILKNHHNKKKSDFEKKIKKFMQSDSPINQPQQSKLIKKKNNRQLKCYTNQNNYSFDVNQENIQFLQNKNLYQNKINQIQLQHKQEYVKINQCQQLYNDTSHQEINQFIQKTCEKMNMPEFNDLKKQMIRAKQQLLNLQKKDNEIEQKKSRLQ